MTFTFKGVTYTIPSDLFEITLSQHIAWQATYGDALQAREDAVLLMPDPERQDLERSLIFLDTCTETLSYWSGIPLVQVQSEMEISQVMNLVAAISITRAEQAWQLSHQTSFRWAAEDWKISGPLESAPEEIMHADFLVIMELARKMAAFAGGDWTALQPLCAAYLRKVGEPFDAAYIQPGNARYELMKDLPLSIALPVGLFLNDSLTVFNELADQHIHDVETLPS